MSEKTAYRSLKRAFKTSDRIERVENVLVTGMPDVNYCIEGAEGWVEIKSAPRIPAREATPVLKHKLSVEQQNWALKHLRAGGRLFYWVSVGEHYFLVDGVYHERLNALNFTELTKVALWNNLRTFDAVGLRKELSK